jgi:hypothetical protein
MEESLMNSPDRGTAMNRLEILEGTWDIEIVFPHPGADKIHGKTVFEWMEGGLFLIQKTTVHAPNTPGSLIIIGFDTDKSLYKMHYFDSRGIDRIYYMTLNKGIWKQWRNDSEFSQRFTGKFNDTENTIQSVWEKSIDGGVWEHDFNLTFKRISGASIPPSLRRSGQQQ